MAQTPNGLLPIAEFDAESELEDAKVTGALVDKIKKSAKKIARG